MMNEIKNIKIPPLKELIKKETLKKYFKKFISLNSTPTHLAWSVAIGCFIGFIIPIGFQTFIIIPLALALGINVIVAYLATLVSNPLTAVPMYFVAVKVGEFFTNIKIEWSTILSLIESPEWDKLMNLGTDTIIVFFTGSFINGLITTVILYFATYKIVVYYRKRHNINSDVAP